MEMRKIDMIILHCSATAIDKPYTMEDLTKTHKERDIKEPCGYHFYIRRDGTIHHGRPLTHVGAHVYGYNTNSIGICYEGGIIAGGRANVASHAKDTRTDAQKSSIKECIKDVYNVVGDYQDMSEVKILGHRDLSPDIDGDGIIERWEWLKQCPCFDVSSENYESLINSGK